MTFCAYKYILISRTENKAPKKEDKHMAVMNEKEIRTWLINEITKTRRAWCKRNNETKETLEARTTHMLEMIYDRAK